jgi:hypothetical protein
MGQSDNKHLETVLTAVQAVFTEHRVDQIDAFFTAEARCRATPARRRVMD